MFTCFNDFAPVANWKEDEIETGEMRNIEFLL